MEPTEPTRPKRVYIRDPETGKRRAMTVFEQVRAELEAAGLTRKTHEERPAAPVVPDWTEEDEYASQKSGV